MNGKNYGSKTSYIHCVGSEPLTSLTLGQIVDIAAERWPNSEALVSVHQDHRFTYKEIREKADKLAAGLIELGMKRGDRLGIWGHNISEWFITRVAAARAGFIAVQIDPAYKAPQLMYSLKKVNVKALVFAEFYKNNNIYEIVREVIPELDSCPEYGVEITNSEVPSLKRLIIMSDKQYKGTHCLCDIMTSALPGSVMKIQMEQNLIEADDGCAIQFSSGTTGQPKGALLSHHNLVNNANILSKNMIKYGKSRLLIATQFCHTSGSLGGIILSLVCGATCVIPNTVFDAAKMVEGIIKERCTFLMATPSLYVDMIAKTKELGLQINSLQVACYGGAPCSASLAMQIYETFNVKTLLPGYGMTEINMVFCAKESDTLQERTETLGLLAEHMEAKVVDREGRMVPFGTPGELCVRGYSVMLGYWNDEEKSREFKGPDGWAKTGDQFILHENGRGQIVGRVKDMIIRIADNIFPTEVEEFFTQHPNILEAEAFGVPDPKVGEEICVYLRLREGAALTEKEIREYCKDKIAEYRIPRYIRFVKSFERTIIGKVQKFRLLEELKKELDIK